MHWQYWAYYIVPVYSHRSNALSEQVELQTQAIKKLKVSVMPKVILSLYSAHLCIFHSMI